MENAKLYSSHDIEQLKQKIDIYKKTLASLKKGTSIEDCINIKIEFDAFKKQLLQFEGSTTDEVLKHVPFDDYEEKVKKMSVQINTLHQQVEEINQEILTMFKQIIANTDSKVSPLSKAPTLQNKEVPIPIEENIPQQSPLLNKQPTFMQLQMIAGKVNLPQNQPPTTTREETIPSTPEMRQFNQPHLQLTSTPPSEMYNGLFRNAAREPALQFKNALGMQMGSAGASLSPASSPTITKQQPAGAEVSSLTTVTSTIQSNEQNSQDHTAVNSTSILQESSASLLNENQTIDAMESEVTEDSLHLESCAAPPHVMEPCAYVDPFSTGDSLHLEPSDDPNLAIEPNNAVDPISADTYLQHESSSSITNETTSTSSYSTDETLQDDELETIAEIDSSTASSTFTQTTAQEELKKEKGNIFFNLFRRKN